MQQSASTHEVEAQAMVRSSFNVPVAEHDDIGKLSPLPSMLLHLRMGVHVEAPASLIVPMEQKAHTLDERAPCSLEYLPLGHAWQDDPPVIL